MPRFKPFWLLAAGVLLSACAAPAPSTDAQALQAERADALRGYLGAPRLDALRLLPAPPAPGSPAQAADDATFGATFGAADAGPGSARWAQAQRDADLRFPQAASAFACTLGLSISAEATPHLTTLLRRSLTDTVLTNHQVKNTYRRTRPFVARQVQPCTAPESDSRKQSDSYPSSHAAIGWAWGLVLAEVAPAQADAVLQRAYAFGESRVVCGMHWPSDVQAARLLASAVVAQLHSSPEFTAQLALARQEVAAAQTRSAAPTACQ